MRHRDHMEWVLRTVRLRAHTTLDGVGLPAAKLVVRSSCPLINMLSVIKNARAQAQKKSGST